MQLIFYFFKDYVLYTRVHVWDTENAKTNTFLLIYCVFIQSMSGVKYWDTYELKILHVLNCKHDLGECDDLAESFS